MCESDREESRRNLSLRLSLKRKHANDAHTLPFSFLTTSLSLSLSSDLCSALLLSLSPSVFSLLPSLIQRTERFPFPHLSPHLSPHLKSAEDRVSARVFRMVRRRRRRVDAAVVVRMFCRGPERTTSQGLSSEPL